MRLRLVTYNILLGGRERTPDLLAVIERERPDVVALQECSGFLPEEGDGLAAYRQRLGMAGVVARGAAKLHLACLARPELGLTLEQVHGGPFRHGALHVKLQTPAGPLALVIVHLNPFVEDARLEEVEYLLGRLPGGPTLLCGDFNGLSPQDPYARERIVEMLPQYQLTPACKSLEAPLPPIAQTRAIGRLIAGGWTDLGHACPGGDLACTYPTPGAPAPEGPPIRIDFVFANAPLAGAARAYRVVHSKPADTASDHFPVVVDLELPEN